MKDKLKWSRENCPLPRTCPVRLDQKVIESVELTSKLTHQNGLNLKVEKRNTETAYEGKV